MEYNNLEKEELIQIIEKKEKDILESQKKLVITADRMVELKSKLDLTNSFPLISERKAEMELMFDIAKKFSAAKAFKSDYSPEQIFVIMAAGKEMGMKEIESLNALYIVNGNIKFYGDKMISRLTKAGYKIEYLDETENEVTVKVSNNFFSAVEKVRKTDQILQTSKAAKFALKNKMRFHGVRMIASFHLPHLFSSVSDEFSSEFAEYTDMDERKNDTNYKAEGIQNPEPKF